MARRDYGDAELRRRLCAKGYAAEEAAAAAAVLADEGLLSDGRFAEAFVRVHSGRGWGPLKIAAALRERGVDREQIETHVDAGDAAWLDAAQTARARRFGAAVPRQFEERARQARFLQSRGFTAEQIRHALSGGDGRGEGDCDGRGEDGCEDRDEGGAEGGDVD